MVVVAAKHNKTIKSSQDSSAVALTVCIKPSWARQYQLCNFPMPFARKARNYLVFITVDYMTSGRQKFVLKMESIIRCNGRNN
jgi:hypothetical protein